MPRGPSLAASWKGAILKLRVVVSPCPYLTRRHWAWRRAESSAGAAQPFPPRAQPFATMLCVGRLTPFVSHNSRHTFTELCFLGLILLSPAPAVSPGLFLCPVHPPGQHSSWQPVALLPPNLGNGRQKAFPFCSPGSCVAAVGRGQRAGGAGQGSTTSPNAAAQALFNSPGNYCARWFLHWHLRRGLFGKDLPPAPSARDPGTGATNASSPGMCLGKGL